MNRQNVVWTATILAAALAGFAGSRSTQPASAAEPTKRGIPATETQIDQLQQQLKQLSGLAPDQAAVMTHVGYHFSNLWFAIEQENWPLADFYLGETRNNVKWAVRTKPVRKTKAGNLELAPIAEAVDNSQFTQLKQAIDAKQKQKCIELYDQTMVACYGCHKASEKPYLRPQRPKNPEVPIINFDPKATKPE